MKTPIHIKIIFLFLMSFLISKDQKAQSSLYMPSATNWVSVGDLDVAGNQLTVEALIYYTGASVDIVSKHTDPGNVNYLLRIGSFEITTTSGFAAFSGAAAAGVTLVSNRMYHVAATYDGAMLKYYVNGCMTGSMPWTGNMIQSNLITAIGNMSTCQCEQFVGYIDEVRIWNVARTQAQIAANMFDLPGPTTQPGLQGYWKFDNSYVNLQGNTTFDGVPQGAPQFQSIPLPYPTALFEAVTSSNPVCAGDANGYINVSASGYYLPYEYSLDGISYGSSPVFPNLPSGNYTVYTRPQNNNNCVVSNPVTLNDPAPLIPNLVSDSVACFGANNGTASVAPSGGDGPVYHQLWQPGLQTGTSVSGLAPGNYSVTISDTCKASGPELIVNGNFEDGNTAFTNGYTCCTGGPGGYAVDANPVYYNGGHSGSGYGGGGNYLIVDGHTTPNTSFWCQTVNVVPNTYYSFSVYVASNYTSSTAVVQVEINGASIGTVNAPGATFVWVPFQTTWFSGANTTASICMIDQNTVGGGNDFGVDNISFKTCASCINTTPFTISEPAALSVAITAQTNVTCNGASNGSATAAANGGTPGYSYSWNTTPVQTGSTANNLSAGTYTVTVTDLNSCTATTTVTISSTTAVNISLVSQVNVSCNGGSNGTATVSASGGTSGYNYSWNTSPVQNTATATNLVAGTYTATVTDANLCTATITATISEPTVLTVATSSQTNVSCNGGNNGSATVSASGGTSGYSYSWNTSPVQTGATASNLSAGSYIATVSDNNMCTATTIITITEPVVVDITLSSQTNVSCNGGTNGTATVAGSGGTGAYNYLWNTSPPQNSATANNLTAGTYTAYVADANFCVDSISVTITEPTALTLVMDSKTDPSCFGFTDGNIYTTAGGGTGTYSYTWLPAVSTADSAINLSSGSYDITVSDANSCTQTITVTLTDPALLTVNATATPGSICRGLNTTLNATVTGGTAGFTYLWDNLAVTASQTIQPLTTTTYTVAVADSKNCTAIDSIQVIVFQPAVIQLGNDTAFCQGDNLLLNAGPGFSSYEWQNGSPASTYNVTTSGMYHVTGIDLNGCVVKDTILITVNPLPVVGIPDTLKICPEVTATINATPGYTSYLWNTTETTSSITVNTYGYYKVIIQDSNGCINSDSTWLIVYPVPQLAFAMGPLTGCSPINLNTINNTISNGSTIQSWDWLIGTTAYNVFEPNPVLADSGFYDVFVQATTTDGCVVDSLTPNYIHVYPMPLPVVYAPVTEYELTDDEMSVINLSTIADTYEWSLFNQWISQDSNLVYPVTDTGHYLFQLMAMNQYGCKDSTQIMLTVNPSFAIYFPNAFSPNDNGNNEVFGPKGYGIHEFEMFIYDRWGVLVYETKDITKGWDGTYKGQPAMRDVYVYKCKIRDIKKDPHYYIGGFTLVR
jgi:gliding motility-associated-like protein